MPKTVYFPEDSNSSGISITWTKSAMRLDVGGWYDTYVGIESSSLTLRKFFDELGITEADCRKAFKLQGVKP